MDSGASFAEIFVWACSVQAMTFGSLEDAVGKETALEFLDAIPAAWRRKWCNTPIPHGPAASRVSKQSPGLGVSESTGHW